MSLEPEQKNLIKLADSAFLIFEKKMLRMLSGLKFFVLQKARGKEEKRDLNSFALHIGELPDFLKYSGERNEFLLTREEISTGLGSFWWGFFFFFLHSLLN